MPTPEASEKTALIMLELGGVVQESLSKFSTALAGYAVMCREDPGQAAHAIEALSAEMQHLSNQMGETLLEVTSIMTDPPFPPKAKMH